MSRKLTEAERKAQAKADREASKFPRAACDMCGATIRNMRPAVVVYVPWEEVAVYCWECWLQTQGADR